MIQEEAILAYNNRIRATITDLGRLSPGQQDAVRQHGSRAEALLANPDLVMFIHQWRFETTDAIAGITLHDPDSNARRVALANQLAGVDSFVAALQRAVYMKNRVVGQQEAPAPHPRSPEKEVYNI